MVLFGLLLATVTPVGNPGAWISADDYPVDALHDNVEGIVTAELVVSQQGTATNCSIAASSGSASLDAATCRLLVERARFKPLQNTDKSSYQTRVQWKIPEAKYTPIALQGFTAFSNFSNGKPVGQCVEEVVGKPIKFLPLCDLIGNPNALAMFGLSSLTSFSALQLQFIIAPSGHTLDRPPRFSMTAQQQILLKAVFELQADSSITNCKLLENSAGEPLGDLCSAIRSGVTDFDVSSSKQFPISMTFVLDSFAE